MYCDGLTLDEVSNSIVDRSSTCRAAAIWDRRRSSFRSFCRSPVRCASSTISVPKWLNALTNSVKLLTPSKRPRLCDTYKRKTPPSLIFRLSTQHTRKCQIGDLMSILNKFQKYPPGLLKFNRNIYVYFRKLQYVCMFAWTNI